MNVKILVIIMVVIHTLVESIMFAARNYTNVYNQHSPIRITQGAQECQNQHLSKSSTYFGNQLHNIKLMKNEHRATMYT